MYAVWNPKFSFSRGLRPLNNDNDVMQFAKYVIGSEVIDVYVDHIIDNPEIMDASELGTKIDDDEHVEEMSGDGNVDEDHNVEVNNENVEGMNGDGNVVDDHNMLKLMMKMLKKCVIMVMLMRIMLMRIMLQVRIFFRILSFPLVKNLRILTRPKYYLMRLYVRFLVATKNKYKLIWNMKHISAYEDSDHIYTHIRSNVDEEVVNFPTYSDGVNFHLGMMFTNKEMIKYVIKDYGMKKMCSLRRIVPKG